MFRKPESGSCLQSYSLIFGRHTDSSLGILGGLALLQNPKNELTRGYLEN
jgi:hypothetical protein